MTHQTRMQPSTKHSYPSAVRLSLLGHLIIFAAILTPYLHEAAAQTDPELTDRLIIRNGDASTLVPYEEVRSVKKGEPLFMAGDRTFTTSDRALQLENQGDAPVEHPVQQQEGADGLIIELRELPLAAVYAEMAQKQGSSSAGVSTLSTEDVQALDEQRTKTVEQQDYVLNRLEALGASGGLSAQGMTHAPVARFHTAVNALVLKNVSLQEIQNAIRDNPDLAARVKRVEPNRPIRAVLDTSVALIKAPEVWELLSSGGGSIDGSGVRIGIVDTGVDYTHPDLGGCFGPGCKVAGGYDVINNDPNPMDDHGHGTHCAATAAGNGTYDDGAGRVIPVRGVAPGATVFAYKVLNGNGSGTWATVIGGVERCADPNLDGDLSDHLDVCSLSLGGDGNPDDTMSLAVDAASRAGVVMVIAAGNSGSRFRAINSPGTSRLAITVAATCKPNHTMGYCSDGSVADFSSRGPVPDYPDVQKPDIAAPGVEICAARFGSYARGNECLGGRRVSISGTSMATPHVAGVAALLRQAHPEALPETIKSALKFSATDLGIPSNTQGAGLVNAFKTLESMGMPSSIARISGAPLSLDLIPNASITEVTRSVAVTSLAKAPLEFVPTFTAEHEDITAVVSPESVTIAPGETVSFNLKVRAKITNIPSGAAWKGRLTFTTTDGVAWTDVYGVIRDRLTSNITELDLGTKNGFDLTWRDTPVLRLTNRLSDVATSYTVSAECCGRGGELSASGIRTSPGSTTIEIPPGGTVDLPITIEATGVDSGHGRYSGKITLSSADQTLTIPITFFKGWEFGLHYESDVFEPYFSLLHTKTLSYIGEELQKGKRKKFLVVDPGPWQMETVFVHDSLSYPEYAFVYKTNVQAMDAVNEVVFRASGDGKLVTMKNQTPTGARPYGLRYVHLNNNLGSMGVYALDEAGTDWSYRIYGFTPNIEFHSSAFAIYDSTILAWQNMITGDGSSGEITLGTEPFVTKYLSLPSSGPSGEGNFILPWATVGRRSISSTVTARRVPAGEVAILQVSANQSLTPSDPLFRKLPSTSLWGYQAADTFVFENVTHKTTVRVSTAGAFAEGDRTRPYSASPPVSDDLASVMVPAGFNDSINLGAGPEVNIGTWYNYPESTSWYTPRFGMGGMYRSSGGAFDVRGAFSRLIEHTLLRDGEPYYSGSDDNYKSLDFIFPPGSYQLKSQRQYSIHGVSTLATTENSFKVNTLSENKQNPTDQNPPSLENLMLISNELIQNVIDPLAANFLHFKLDPRSGLLGEITQDGLRHNDPMPDEVHSVTLEQSTDGKVWTSLTTEVIAEGEYRAEVSVIEGAQLYSFRISALDSAGNTFKHNFQLPTGQAHQIPTNTPTATATPMRSATATPTATRTPIATATPRANNTAAATPTAVVRPTPGLIVPDADKRLLPPPRLLIRRKKVVVTLPAVTSLDLAAEALLALNWLESKGFSKKDAMKMVATSQWSGQCGVTFQSGRKRPRIVSTWLRASSARVIVMENAPQKSRKFAASYTCKFSTASIGSYTTGQVRRSLATSAWLRRSSAR